MESRVVEATLLSVIVLGVVFALGIGSLDWGVGVSVLGAVVATLLFLALYAGVKWRGSGRS